MIIRLTIEIEEGKEPVIVSKKIDKSKPVAISDTIEVHKTGKPIADKTCIVCGKSFTPLSGAQKRCSIACGMKLKSEKEKAKIQVPIESSIDEVMQEVEQSQSKPYEFGK